MNKTKIDWCDMSWNPVTGCLHGCKYCYAAKIVKRFSCWGFGTQGVKTSQLLHVLNEKYDKFGKLEPYPFGFEPTFHRYRLDEPAQKTKPRNVFVCSMADLFGAWVPDEWTQEIFTACAAAPQHQYLFLTKNPEGIERAVDNYTGEDRGCSDAIEFFNNFWFGTSVTRQEDAKRIETLAELREGHRFLSVEPILGPVTLNLEKNRCPVCGSLDIYEDNPATRGDASPLYCDECGKWEGNSRDELKPSIDWVIIGAETGNRKEKVIPQREWIESIVNECRAAGVPVFMKSSLADIWGAPLIQEFPWEVHHA